MKTFLLLIFAVIVATANAVPYGLDPEYAMVPEVDGTWKLININEDPEAEGFFEAGTDVYFSLFTRSNPTTGHPLWRNDAGVSVGQSHFNAEHGTRVIIHGWNTDGNALVNSLVREAYLAKGDFNVIVVDWGLGANTINFISAKNRVPSVGAVTGELIRELIDDHGVDESTVTVIGHSLGAHVAGFAGKDLIANGKLLGNIVALETALPLYSITDAAGRVNNGDAAYVQSIHTNGGTLGFKDPIGVGSFYPNYGSSQPGCTWDIVGNCAHGRSYHYFAESINTPTHFWSRKCADFGQITNKNCVSSGSNRKMGGEPLDTDATGIYYTTTNSASLFAKGTI